MTDTKVFDTIAMQIMQPETRANPYPLYRLLQDHARVARYDNGWFLSGHAEVSMIRDPRFAQRGRLYEQFKSRLSELRPWHRVSFSFMLSMDPPDHTRVRSLVNTAFTPRAVEALRPRIREIVDGLLDAASAKDELDLIADFAYPLPVTVICELLGIPTDERDQFREWSRSLAPVLENENEEKLRVADKATEGMVAYFAPLIAHHRRSPRDDLLSALIAAEEDGARLSADEVLANLLLLFFAGHETTVNLVGNGVLALLRNRDQWDRLCADPALSKGAAEEVLRYDSPVQITSRNVAADMEISGHEIPAGDHVEFILGAANRDPLVFPEPDRLDITRENAARHVSFGGGMHFCVGAPLARLEGQIALQALAQRMPTLRLLDPDPEWRDTLVLHGLKALPVGY